MKINIVAVGKVKEPWFAGGIEEYLKRLSRFAEVRVIEIKEENTRKEGEAERALTVKKEGEKLLAELRGYVICLAIEGRKITSEAFAEKLSAVMTGGAGEITFVIGGSYGISDQVKNRADYLMSFSDMTFPHTMARLILTEQLYRAFMINSGSSYHK